MNIRNRISGDFLFWVSVVLSVGTLAIAAADVPRSTALDSPPPVPDEYAWEVIPELSDEFTGTTLDDKKWLPKHPDWNGHEPSVFDPSNVSVKDGMLHLRNTTSLKTIDSLKNRASGRLLQTLRVNASRMFGMAWLPDAHQIVTSKNITSPSELQLWKSAGPVEVAKWDDEENSAARRLAAVERNYAVEKRRAREGFRTSFLNQWLVMKGVPLQQSETASAALDREQVDREPTLKPKAEESIIAGNQRLRWQTKVGELFFNEFSDDSVPRTVEYGVCYLHMAKPERGIRMWIQGTSEVKIYLNGKELFKRQSPLRAWDEEVIQDVDLNAGVNVLVLKLINGGGNSFGAIRLTDAEENPLTDLRLTLDPDRRR